MPRHATIGDSGDDAFERSRGKAIEAHDQLLRKFEEDRTGERALKRLAELGVDFKDLHTEQSSLEDIFVSLVHSK